MDWWCHCTLHQRELLILFCWLFFADGGTNFSFVAQKVKINHYHLSRSPPSFAIWVYIIFNKAWTKLWTPDGKIGYASATLCRCKWMASLKPPRTVCRSFSNPRPSFKNTSNQIKAGNKADATLSIIQFKPVLFWSFFLSLSLSPYTSLGVWVLCMHIQRELRRKGVNN